MNARNHLVTHLVTIARVTACTMCLCSMAYPVVLWIVGRIFTPHTAEGWLLRDERGKIVGSEVLAQSFIQPGYFWPRPSATDYSAASSGGSNLSPANPALSERTSRLLAQWESEKPVPMDLVTTSGSGLDPHISLEAALYQVPRVALARGVQEDLIVSRVKREASKPNRILDCGVLINVLRLNRILDQELGSCTISSKSLTIGMTP